MSMQISEDIYIIMELRLYCTEQVPIVDIAGLESTNISIMGTESLPNRPLPNTLITTLH